MTAQKIIPARNWGQRVAATLLTIVVGLLVFMVATSRHINWSAIPQYIFDETIFDGIRLTILFTVLSMIISIVAGAILATMRLSSNPVLSGFASLYIWFFRGTPLLVQIIFWFNIQLFIPSIDIGSFHTGHQCHRHSFHRSPAGAQPQQKLPIWPRLSVAGFWPSTVVSMKLPRRLVTRRRRQCCASSFRRRCGS